MPLNTVDRIKKLYNVSLIYDIAETKRIDHGLGPLSPRAATPHYIGPKPTTFIVQHVSFWKRVDSKVKITS